MGKETETILKDNVLNLEFTGYDTNSEQPVFYKSKESKAKDFYLVHAYTPENFTLLRYIEIGGVVTTHFSTITNKYDLQEIVTKGMYQYKQLIMITREEYMKLKNMYDNHMKSIHV